MYPSTADTMVNDDEAHSQIPIDDDNLTAARQRCVSLSSPVLDAHVADINSLSPSVCTTSVASTISTTIAASTSSISDLTRSITRPHNAPRARRHNPRSSMTTYYHYNEDGALEASTIDSVEKQLRNWLLTPGIALPEGDLVGAWIASHAMLYPAYDVRELRSEGFGPPGGYYSAPIPPPQMYFQDPDWHMQRDWSSGSYDSQPFSSSIQVSSYTSNGSGPVVPSSSGRPHVYPNPEAIRNGHSLYNLLPYLQPARRLHALHEGATLDIIEQDTGNIFYHQASKKLLVLFLGRNIVNKFIRTTAREDIVHWRGLPTCQELCLPRGVASKVALRILISWMTRACQSPFIHEIRPIHVPNNTFAACSLAQTMELLGLHRDAYRVDMYITKYHFMRPIFAVELETLWNCFNEKSKYVYAAIRIVGSRLRAHGDEPSKKMPGWEDMLAMLEEYPNLKKRVHDLKENERFRPTFGRDWFKKLGGQAQAHDGSQDVGAGADVGVEKGGVKDAVSSGPSLANGTKPRRKFAVLRIVDSKTSS